METETHAPAVTIREAGRDDIEKMLEMHERCSADTLALRYFVPVHPSRRLLETLLERSDTTVVAVDGDEVVAVGQLGRDPGEHPELGVLVRDDRQRQGLGRRILAHLVAEAERAGADAVQIVTLDENPAPRRAMESLGHTGRSSADHGVLTTVYRLRSSVGA